LEVERVKGQVDQKVRHDPGLFGLENSPKEAAVKSVVVNDKDLIKAENNFHKAYELQYLLDSIVKAFEQRKELLRGEGELWREGYYSDARVNKSVEDRGRREVNKKELTEDMGERVPLKRRPLSSK
jgi:hypothetical protein